MIKIAFFVEGKTERIFIEKLLDNYFSHPFFNIESYELIADKAKVVTKSKYSDQNIQYYFLIFDVGGDERVVSSIYERHKKLLHNNGFNHIFGLRDLFPNSKEDLAEIKKSFQNIFNPDDIVDKISLIIAIMEIEAWFLADYHLFERLSNKLNPILINQKLDIKIETDYPEEYSHPSVIIDKIYQIIDRRYKKRETDSHSICSYIDFCELCLNDTIKERIPSFNSFFKLLSDESNLKVVSP